jgi:hypothetical protein
VFVGKAEKVRRKNEAIFVQRDRPLKRWLTVPLAAALLLVGGWTARELARDDPAAEYAAVRQERDGLRAELRRAERQRTELRERVALLERAAQVDQAAYAAVAHDLTALQDEILALRQELAFYRNVIAPPDARPGLRIQSVRLARAADERLYRYKVVLIQVTNNEQQVHGAVNLVISGTLEGNLAKLPLEQVSLSDGQELAFRFRYFQSLEGEFLLPEGYVPHSLQVQAVSEGGSQAVLEQTFDWPSLVEGS